MKLYEVPRDTWVMLNEEDGDYHIFKFHHIDGMYSYCTDQYGNVCHYKAWSDVTILDDPP